MLTKKEKIKLEYSKYIGDDRKPVHIKKLPNNLVTQIRKNFKCKNSLDEELFNDGLLISFKKIRVSWSKESTFNTYKDMCIKNGGPVYNIDSGLQRYIIKFFTSKYDLEKLLGYHNFENIKPIITSYEEEPDIENPKYLMKRFGDYEKGYTGEEEILVRELQLYQKDYKKVKEFSEPSIIKIKDLNDDKRMFYGVKINAKSEKYDYRGALVKNSTFNDILVNTINVDDPKLWWLVGRWLGDGWLRDNERKNRKNGRQQWVYICCGKHELHELVNFFETFQIQVGYNEERTTFRFKITLKEWFDFFSQFGKGAKGKFIPEKVKNLPKHLLKELLDGYFSADGWYDKKRNYWTALTVGKKLAHDLVECIEKVYEMPVTLTRNQPRGKSIIEGRIINNSISYTISFKKDIRLQDKGFYENGYLWYPINYVKNILNELDYSSEIWKPIAWLNNQFSISNFGRVKSHKNNDKLKKIIYRIGYKRLTKRNYFKSGYVSFMNHNYRVCDLVWEAFGSHKKEDNMEISFIDGNFKNIHISNLDCKTNS